MNIDNYPWVISYPRTGSHWLNNSIELYTNRPKWRRGKSFLPQSNTNYLYYHDHDMNLDLLKRKKINKILYLYRNPLDVIFSYAKADEKINDDGWISMKTEEYKNHLDAWLQQADVIVKYEDLKNEIGWEKISIFFNMEHDILKWKDVWNRCEKKNIIEMCNNNYMNKSMLDGKYEIDRQTFKNKYQEHFNLIFKKYENLI